MVHRCGTASNMSFHLKYPATVLNHATKMNSSGDSNDLYCYSLSKHSKGSKSFTFGAHGKEESNNKCSSSDLCLTEAHCTDLGKRLNYSLRERFADKENIESNMEDIDFLEMKNLRTLPPKYSNENDIRNNIICTNNNIYIYAENKNGTLNEQARISVSNNNVIHYATKGRRYTIGGYADIQKKVNNEYAFFDAAAGLDITERMNTFEFDTIDSEDVLTSLNKINLAKANEVAFINDAHKLDSSNLFVELMKQPNSFHSEHSFNGKSLSGNLNIQNLLQDRKRYAQNVEHEQRICKPCAHVYNGSTCMNGDNCAFCHHSDHELISAKKWKKLVKNNVAKLNLLLEVLRDPNEANINLLNEVMKPSVKSGIKKHKKRVQNNFSVGLNMHLNMINNTHMHMYNSNFNNHYRPYKYNNYNNYNNYHPKQNGADRIPRNGGYGFVYSSDTLDSNRTRHFVGHHRMGTPRNYNNVFPTPHIPI